MYIHGSADGTVAYANGTPFSSTQGLSLNNFPDVYCAFGEDHNFHTWDDNCYNRSTAKFDYIEWIKAFSRDQSQRASLHVVRAENESNTSIHKNELLSFGKETGRSIIKRNN